MSRSHHHLIGLAPRGESTEGREVTSMKIQTNVKAGVSKTR